jgi:hypothetical protein
MRNKTQRMKNDIILMFFSCDKKNPRRMNYWQSLLIDHSLSAPISELLSSTEAAHTRCAFSRSLLQQGLEHRP